MSKTKTKMMNILLTMTLVLGLIGCNNTQQQIKDINTELDKCNNEFHLLNDSINKHMNDAKSFSKYGEVVKVEEELIIIDSLKAEVKVIFLYIDDLNKKKNRIIEENQ